MKKPAPHATAVELTLKAAQSLRGQYHAATWHTLTPKQKTQQRAATARRLAEREAERRKIRLLEDARWAITRLASRSLRAAVLQRSESSKYANAAGYTIAELRAHLEAHFQDGMSWGNAPKWHIDHVRPAASFVFTSIHDEGFRRCFALSNLQPLWALENCYKDARYSCEPQRERMQRDEPNDLDDDVDLPGNILQTWQGGTMTDAGTTLDL